MKHFEVQSWVDFARNLSTPEQRMQMQKHLDDGCGTCAKELQTWSQVTEVAAKESTYEPADATLRVVRAQFANQSGKEKKSAVAKLAELMFDSVLQPAVAGIRAGEASGRQLLYKHGSCFIDMRVEQEKGENEVSLVGQVLDSGAPEASFKRIPVYLLRKHETIGKTETNDAGEFNLRFKSEEDLRISFGVPGESVMVIIPPFQRVPKPGTWL